MQINLQLRYIQVELLKEKIKTTNMKNLIIMLVILFVSCKPPSENIIETKTIELELLQTRIDSLFNSEIGENEPGAALLVSYDGEMIIGKGYGLRDTETNQPITVSTNLRMASVSKQFTALCILSLVDKGELSLNDEAYSYLPYPIFKKITIEHLLNHTSGLPDYYKHFEKSWDKSKIVENKNILEWLATNPDPIFNPGEEWKYSNTAYLMLALIVEKVSGIEFSKFAKENVFMKAGMLKTNYFNLALPIEISERAFCYGKDSLGQFQKVDGFFMNGIMGDGAVYTSVNDYFKYDLALRNETILSEATHKLIFKPSSTLRVEGIDRNYAMGWSVTDSTANHSGSWYGTNTYVYRNLKKPLTIAVFANSYGHLSPKELVGKIISYTEEF